MLIPILRDAKQHAQMVYLQMIILILVFKCAPKSMTNMVNGVCAEQRVFLEDGLIGN